MADGSIAIEVRDVAKSFVVPTRRVDTLKERVVRPLHRSEDRRHDVLEGVSFDVARGEFFGIVGRNGSGKSTLLKILASIYGADRGRVRMAGRLAPFIELGVGFDPELTAQANVALAGVLMGLGRREASRRLDAVLDFAELREFADLKLKNYSSGMFVRLAFATMVEADADVMLIDEVLAVGDAAFAQRCMDVFASMHAAGRTIVLVTHDMATVQRVCDRAMLLDEGRIGHLGDPEEVALRYYRQNFGAEGEGLDRDASGSVLDVNVRVAEARLLAPDGQPHPNVEQGDPVTFEVVLEARQPLTEPVFNFHVLSEEGAWVLAFSHGLDVDAGEPDRIEPGGRVRLTATITNPLLPGRYRLDCWISRRRAQGDLALHVVPLLDFLVYGTRPGPGSVEVEAELELAVEPATPA